VKHLHKETLLVRRRVKGVSRLAHWSVRKDHEAVEASIDGFDCCAPETRVTSARRATNWRRGCIDFNRVSRERND
jgi:hypothetical protein